MRICRRRKYAKRGKYDVQNTARKYWQRAEQNAYRQEKVGTVIPWEEYLYDYRSYIPEEQLKEFQRETLLKRYQAGERFFSKDISYQTRGAMEWLTIEVSLSAEKVIHGTSREQILKRLETAETHSINYEFRKFPVSFWKKSIISVTIEKIAKLSRRSEKMLSLLTEKLETRGLDFMVWF